MTLQSLGGNHRRCHANIFFCTLQLFGHMPPRCLQLFMSSISCYSNLLPLLCSYVKIHLWVVITPDVSDRSDRPCEASTNNSSKTSCPSTIIRNILVSPRLFVIFHINDIASENQSESQHPLRHTGLKWLRFFNWTPRCDWCLVHRGPKNKHHHQDTCLKEGGLHLQTLITTIHSIVNTIESTYICIQLKNQQTCISNNHN